MPKPDLSKYPEVKTLPKGALSVFEYAEEQGFTTQHVYNMVRNNKLKDKGKRMIVFHGFCYVAPLERTKA